MRYIIEHTKLGFDWLDLLALIILLVVVIVWAVRRHNLKSEQKDLQLYSFICSLAFDVYVKKQVIEKLIDQMPEPTHKNKK